MPHHPQDENTIGFHIFIYKVFEEVLIAVFVFLHESEVLLDEAFAVGLAEHAQRPAQEGEAAHGRHEHQPEPDEQVDHLVEQVDSEHTLNGVPLQVTQPTHLEVTHCYSGKAWGV